MEHEMSEEGMVSTGGGGVRGRGSRDSACRVINNHELWFRVYGLGTRV